MTPKITLAPLLFHLGNPGKTADPSHQVLRLFDQRVNLFKLGRMPAQVIVDKQGFARFAHYGHSMSDIPENQELLDLLAELNG